MKRRPFLKTGVALGMAAFAGCAGPETGVQTTENTATGTETSEFSSNGAQTGQDYTVETVTGGFAHPWGLSFLPDESQLLVTERPGQLQLLDVSDGTRSAVAGIPAVYASGQGGLLDVTVGTKTEGPWIYLTYAVTNQSGATATRLARARVDTGESRLNEFEVLHTAAPFVDSNGHFGSRVIIAPDETLYMTVGDRQRKNFGPDHVAQDPSNELGATLRLNPDGTVPDDNPFLDDPEIRDTIFSYGHRNAQGMTVHPVTGAIWQAEHGERDGDEINIIKAGGNYGWPVASYACHYNSDDPVGDPPDERTEFVEPVFYWPCGSGGFPPSGMTFYDGNAFPHWQGDLFVGTLAGNYLGRFTVNGRSVTEEAPILADRNWRIRAVEVAPHSGELFVAVDAAQAPIVRIKPT